jgi:hypothetical protein
MMIFFYIIIDLFYALPTETFPLTMKSFWKILLQNYAFWSIMIPIIILSKFGVHFWIYIVSWRSKYTSSLTLKIFSKIFQKLFIVRGRNKQLTALKSNSNTVGFNFQKNCTDGGGLTRVHCIYIYIYNTCIFVKPFCLSKSSYIKII